MSGMLTLEDIKNPPEQEKVEERAQAEAFCAAVNTYLTDKIAGFEPSPYLSALMTQFYMTPEGLEDYLEVIDKNHDPKPARKIHVLRVDLIKKLRRCSQEIDVPFEKIDPEILDTTTSFIIKAQKSASKKAHNPTTQNKSDIDSHDNVESSYKLKLGADKELELIRHLKLVAKGRSYKKLPPLLQGSVTGAVFEELVLEELYGGKVYEQELSNLIIELLREPYREISQYTPNPEGLIEESATDLDHFLREAKDRAGERYIRANVRMPATNTKRVEEEAEPILTYTLGTRNDNLQNPDGLLVDIMPDEKTGKRKAVIRGLIEVKVGKRDSKQLSNQKENIYKLFPRLKHVYKELIKGLDIEEGLPDEIDIVPYEDFRTTVIVPNNPAEKDRREGNNVLLHTTFTRQQVEAYTQKLLQ